METYEDHNVHNTFFNMLRNYDEMLVLAHSLMVVSDFLRLPGHMYIKENGPMQAIDAKHSLLYFE